MVSLVGFIVCGMLLYLGGIALWDKDKAWKWHESRMKQRGLLTQRTDEWDNQQSVSGCLLIFFGMITLGFAIVTLFA